VLAGCNRGDSSVRPLDALRTHTVNKSSSGGGAPLWPRRLAGTEKGRRRQAPPLISPP
jgi:hypothetical protein